MLNAGVFLAREMQRSIVNQGTALIERKEIKPI